MPQVASLPPTTDTVFLAAAVAAEAGMRVLDAGAGSGAAALCLAVRVPGIEITALEREAAPAQAARVNVAANLFGNRIDVIEQDLAAFAQSSAASSFDAVLTNPPYLDPAASRGSPDPLRRSAMVESMPLSAWVTACLALLRPGGEFVLVHRKEREADLIAVLQSGAGDIAVMELRAGGAGDAPARRLLVRATKGADGSLVRAEPMVLHGPDGRYTARAEAILREGAALTWVANAGTDTK